jgi:hypothetical protein
MSAEYPVIPARFMMSPTPPPEDTSKKDLIEFREMLQHLYQADLIATNIKYSSTDQTFKRHASIIHTELENLNYRVNDCIRLLEFLRTPNPRPRED